MGIGDLNDGSRFGLPPIGLPTTGLDASRQDTERHAFPSLATKGSVFAWDLSNTILADRVGTAANYTDTINLRQNAVTGGASVDVPLWAAGVLVLWGVSVTALGVGVTTHTFQLRSVSGTIFGSQQFTGVSPLTYQQLICPFYDEPVFVAAEASAAAAAGTVSSRIYLLGFVRNV